jgi:hypothetical protein
MVPASLSLEIVTSLSEQQKAVRTDGMVYNELTDVDATPARAAARLNRQLLGAVGGPNGGQKWR